MNDIETKEIEMDDTGLFAIFVQKNTEYYLRRFDRYKNGRKYTFNVFAFIFGLFWFMYRKMYLEAIIIVAVLIVEGFLENLMVADMSEDAARAISGVTTIAIAIAIGTLANALYIRKAERNIIQAKQDANNITDLAARLKQKGGVSYWFFLVIFIALAGIVWYFYTINNQS